MIAVLKDSSRSSVITDLRADPTLSTIDWDLASLESAGGLESIESREADAIVFEESGLLVLPEHETRGDLIARISTEVVELEPELWFSVVPRPTHRVAPGPVDAARRSGPRGDRPGPSGLPGPITWGLGDLGALARAGDGSGIKVAVLDTGVAAQHPDLKPRVLLTESFVPGEGVEDRHGHGTHCCGTIAGPRAPAGTRPGYGVAPGVDLIVGKVLADNGRGRTSWILAGISWALAQGAQVISLSLGSPNLEDRAYLTSFETIASRALAQGTVIFAAAGNDSWRDHGVAYDLDAPASCPSVAAVGAVDPAGRIAYFSNGNQGSPVDLVAPGVGVYSSWLGADYRELDGTSMATPHAASVAALLASRDPTLRGASLRRAVLDRCAPRDGPPGAFGRGLVQV